MSWWQEGGWARASDVLTQLQLIEQQANREGELRGVHGERPAVDRMDRSQLAALMELGSTQVATWVPPEGHPTEVVDVTRMVRTGWFVRPVTVRVVRNVPGPRRPA